MNLDDTVEKALTTKQPDPTVQAALRAVLDAERRLAEAVARLKAAIENSTKR
ncbi:MAG: hypothetical protein JST16_06495 [Bdellovibrionales bacterium]|nr:hypothetical protein [Bdellovibrionales bacterium]